MNILVQQKKFFTCVKTVVTSTTLYFFILQLKSKHGPYNNHNVRLLITFESGFKIFRIDISVSRALLKPVYRFGILNSDPQTLKSVKINLSKNRQMTCRRATKAMLF